MGGKTAIALGLVSGLLVGGLAIGAVVTLTPGPAGIAPLASEPPSEPPGEPPGEPPSEPPSEPPASGSATPSPTPSASPGSAAPSGSSLAEAPP